MVVGRPPLDSPSAGGRRRTTQPPRKIFLRGAAGSIHRLQPSLLPRLSRGTAGTSSGGYPPQLSGGVTRLVRHVVLPLTLVRRDGPVGLQPPPMDLSRHNGHGGMPSLHTPAALTRRGSNVRLRSLPTKRSGVRPSTLRLSCSFLAPSATQHLRQATLVPFLALRLVLSNPRPRLPYFAQKVNKFVFCGRTAVQPSLFNFLSA